MHESLDVLTERSGIAVVRRPLIALSVRMAEALRACAEAELELVIAGGLPCRMTLPLRLMLGPGVRWAVKGADGGYFDGLTGVVLSWDGTALVGGEAVHPEFVGAEAEALWLVVTATVRHRATERLMVGGLPELVCEFLTGAGPEGWGACEPVAAPWNRAGVTAMARERAPQRTLLVLRGRSAMGTMEVDRTASGVEETVTLAASFEGELPDLAELTDRVAGRFGLVSLTGQAMPGRRDLTTEPVMCGLPAPIGVAVGPGVWCQVGDGRDPADWAAFQAVIERGMGPLNDKSS